MTEIELHRETTHDLAGQVEYAKLVSAGSLLPDTYRGKPANVLIAMGLGQSMGLSPAESLYRIAVIKGKPTASGELIAANVRKAGHKLRIVTDEQAQSVTATIIRSDDPEFPFEVTRDMEWAQRMGLSRNDNYTKQPMTMLQWRAVTAAARLACPEALYGVQYTPDEIGDLPDRQPQQGGLAAALAEDETDEPVEAELVDEPEQPRESPLLNTRSNLAKRMYATINDAGITDNERIPWISSVIGREITSSKEMTEAEASQVIDHLADAMEPTEDAS